MGLPSTKELLPKVPGSEEVLRLKTNFTDLLLILGHLPSGLTTATFPVEVSGP